MRPPQAVVRLFSANFLTLGSLILLCLCAVAAVLVVGERERENVSRQFESRLTARAEIASAGLQQQIDAYRYAIRFLSQVPPISGIARASHNNGFDAQEQSSYNLWKKRLETIFRAYVSTNPEITQLRYIGLADDGRELVRVDKMDNQASVVPEDRLQPKGGRDYFQETQKLPVGRVYVSDINLNREHGKVQIPLTPTIRIATPVAGPDGKFFGIVILNVDASLLLKTLNPNLSGGNVSPLSVYLTNSVGDFLFHPDTARTFGFDLGRRWRWQDEFQPADKNSSAMQEPNVKSYMSAQGLVHTVAQRIALEPGNPGRDLILLATVSDRVIAQAVTHARATMLQAILAGLVLVGSMVYLHMRQRRKAGEQQARLAAMVESSHDAIIGKTLDGHVTSWNKGAEQMFGYRAEEAVGRLLADLIVPPDAVAEEAAILARIARGEVVSSFNTRRRRSDGQLCDVSVTVSPIRASDGSIVGAAKTVRDISAQIAAEERFRLVVEAAPNAMLMIDKTRRIILVNRKTEEMFGYPREDLLGAPIEKLVPERYQGKHPGHVDGFFQDPRARAMGSGRELFGRRADATEVPIEIGLNPIETADGLAVLASIIDISERKRSEERFRLVVEAAPNAMLMIDKTRRIILVNQKTEEMFGYARAELLGAPIEKLVPERYQQRHPGHVDGFFSDPRARAMGAGRELFGQRADGTEVPIEIGLNPIETGDGLAVLASIIDISERKRNEAKIHELNASLELQVRERTAELESTRDQLLGAARVAELGIWTWHLAANTLEWNERMCEIYDIPSSLREAGLNYGHWLARIHPEDVGGVLAGLNRSVEGAANFDTVFRIVRSDGSIRFVQAAGRVERDGDGKAVHMMGITRDITEQREVMETLRAAKQAADNANRAKSDFVANMSHEIRSPMNAVLGMLTLLRQTTLDARQKDYADKAESSARALLGILNDILDFSKVEAGKLALDPHPFSLDKLLRDIAVILSANVGEKDIEVLFEIDPSLPNWIVGDALRLQQVLLNLASNAIKFTAHGEVVLSTRLVSQQASGLIVEFAIRDTGIGISAEQCAHIFDGFSQAEASTARRYGGTGLGLAISQRLVSLMGGELKVESTLGQGSVFRFNMVCAATSMQQFAEAICSARLQNLHCLVVDDNPSARMALASIVTAFGWQADIAENGALALAKVVRRGESDPYDVVFIDWRMPSMDGWETSTRIRQLLPAEKTPLIVMVTAYERELLVSKYRQLDEVLDGVLVKPITPSMLFDAVADAKGGQRSGVSGAAAADGSERRLAGLNLLVVEDNLTNQQVAYELLTNEGAQVELADGGVAAIDIMQQGRSFDLILMDIQMPDMDGYAATRAIRARQGPLTPPIVAMTANVLASDRQEALAAGMVDHIGKPFDLKQLVELILRYTRTEQGARPNFLSGPSAETENHATEAATPTDPHGWNSAAALARLGGNRAIYGRILHSFIREVETLGVSLQSILQARQYDEAARRLHTLKGLAGTAGAETLARILAQAEELFMAEDGHVPSQVEMEAVRTSCREALDGAKALAAQIDVAAVAPVDGSAIR